jgi:hypothetical protein
MRPVQWLRNQLICLFLPKLSTIYGTTVTQTDHKTATTVSFRNCTTKIFHIHPYKETDPLFSSPQLSNINKFSSVYILYSVEFKRGPLYSLLYMLRSNFHRVVPTQLEPLPIYRYTSHVFILAREREAVLYVLLYFGLFVLRFCYVHTWIETFNKVFLLIPLRSNNFAAF